MGGLIGCCNGLNWATSEGIDGRLATRDSPDHQNQFNKWALGDILDSILVKHATVLLYLHTFNCLSISKN